MESFITPEVSSAIQTRGRAAALAFWSTVALTVFKLGVGWISGSIGVWSEGIHSFLDLISAAVTFFTVPRAIQPADEDHPFGHGKFETLSSLFEALLLVAAAGFISAHAFEHLMHPQPVRYENLAIAVISISAVASYVVFRQNSLAAQVTDSSALRVNALHFLSDVLASLGVLFGLVMLKLTGWLIIDPIMAFLVAGYILLVSGKQVLQALSELSDTQLPDEEVQAIRKILSEFDGRIIEAHDLRTRKSGAFRHVDFHLVVCGHLSVEESHSLCDEMENAIVEKFPMSSVNIHVEPCEHARKSCQIDCEYFKKRSGR